MTKKIAHSILLPFAAIAVVILLLSCAGCLEKNSKKKNAATLDSDGDGLPDDEDLNPFQPDWGLNLTYLDDTETEAGEYQVTISAGTDYGVLLVDNTGVGEDTFDLSVVSKPDGCEVSLDKPSVTLDNLTIECVTLTFTITSASGDVPVIIQGTSANSIKPVAANITLVLIVEGTSGSVTAKGDKVVVDYTLFDVSGSQIESGTLPGTAGEKYVGPAQQLGYIVGFYMGLLGMKKPPGVVGMIGSGEVKKIRVPPELAYGTDPSAHELGGQTLIFQLTLRSSS
jgi:hypothetical protein